MVLNLKFSIIIKITIERNELIPINLESALNFSNIILSVDEGACYNLALKTDHGIKVDGSFS